MIVYYLGAGASAGKIPVVNGFLTELESDLRKQFENIKSSLHDEPRLKSLALQVLMTISQVNATWSVDTYAKNVRMDMKKYSFLKEIIATYLNVMEETNGVDPRYDLLFSTLIDKVSKKKFVVKKDVNFIIWNYDNQVQLSLLKLLFQNDLSGIENKIKSKLISNRYPSNRIPFSEIKLNGSASKYSWGRRLGNRNSVLSRDVFYKVDKYDDNYLMTFLNEVSHRKELGIKSDIKYAWDKSIQKSQDFSVAQNLLENAQFVVVIGYSFPDFNREIDQLVFSKVNPGAKIYFQCTSGENRHFENANVIKRFVEFIKPSMKDRLEAIDDNTKFWLPEDVNCIRTFTY